MKSIKYLMISFLAAGAMVACTENHDYDPTPQESGAGVYINSEVKTSVQAPDGTTEFTFPINRMNSEGELTVALNIEQSDDNFFTLPSSVTFADGVDEVEVKVTFTAEDLEYDVANQLRIDIADTDNTSLYAKSTITFTIVRPGPWLSLGKADYTDDIVGPLFGAKPVTYKVELQAALLEKDWGTFRLVNAYGEAFPYNDPGDWDDSSDHYLEFRIEDLKLDPNSETFLEDVIASYSDYVWIDDQNLYVNWGYGYMGVASSIRPNLDNGIGMDVIHNARPEWFGTLDKGVITFQKQALHVTDDDGTYYANNNGAFRVVFPGVKLGNYSVTAELAGFFNDLEDNWFAVADVTLGKHVEYALAASAAGSDADALYDAIVAGEVETVTLDASGKVNLPIGEGTSTIVVVTYDAEDAPQEYDFITFKHYSGTVTVNPLDEEWTMNDLYEIEKEELFKTWTMYCNRYNKYDDERVPMSYITFAESDVTDEEDSDYIEVTGLTLGIIEDDTMLWEYYEGFIYNIDNGLLLQVDDEEYLGFLLFSSSGPNVYGGSYGLIGGLVDDGYIAFADYDTGYDINGYGLYAYGDPEGEDVLGAYGYFYNIMLEDPALGASAAKASVRRNAGLSELKTLAQNMAPAKNFVELRGRERAHALIDELKANKKAAGPKEEFEILSWKNNPNTPAKGAKLMKQLQSAPAVIAL